MSYFADTTLIYFGIAGNFRALQKVYRAVERYWHKMLCSRCWKGGFGWTRFHQIMAQSPLLRPKLYLPYRERQYRYAVNQLLKSVGGRSARYVPWEPEAGDCFRPPGSRRRNPLGGPDHGFAWCP